MLRRVVFVFLVCVVLSPVAVAASMQFRGPVVVASGLTPGASVAWFGVTLQPLGYEVRSDRIAVMGVADAAGIASYDAGAAVPLRSVWVAVDLTSGEHVTGMPSGSPGRVLELDQRSFTAPGRLTQQLMRGHNFREVLIVRSGVGAWTLSVGDGGASDEDARSDGNITMSAVQFAPLQESGPPPPSRFLPGDLVIAIEAFKLEMFVVRVAR